MSRPLTIAAARLLNALPDRLANPLVPFLPDAVVLHAFHLLRWKESQAIAAARLRLLLQELKEQTDC